ncbi:MAG: TDP-N-acetylfucosamine:lipid II N-acetylfucosaminyltransferase [Marinagarivorans sp.]|nr:TDP-N-acetylfucosamine:lipid II N-acetylfucosaminyltransferase [Marinagarivorans sp.]
MTYLPGDYRLACDWYAAKGKYVECIGYLSNIYQKAYSPTANVGTPLTIWVGNSADPSNCHEEILEALYAKNKDVRIICPLSYGSNEHAKKIKALGESLFGSNFIALMDIMPLEEYLNLLDTSSVAVFAHHRQQGMGNTISFYGEWGRKLLFVKEVRSSNCLNL